MPTDRRLAWATTAAAVIVLTAGPGCGDRGPTGLERRAIDAASQRGEQARAAARQAGLPADVADFVGTAARASGARFTVTYDLTGRKATFTQRPPFRRLAVDDVPVPGDAEAAIVNAAGSFSCHRTSGTWTCQADGSPLPPVGPLSVDDMVGTVQSLTASAQRFDLRIERARIANTSARCLVVTPRAGANASDQPQRLCISAEGAPLLVESSGQTVRALTYRRSAAAGDFDLPARPSSSTTSG